MEEDKILDLPQQATDNALYVKKSGKLFRTYAGLFFLSFLITFIKNGIGLPDNIILELFSIIQVVMILSIVLAPLGLYYTWKSKKLNEGHNVTRLKYAFGHLFFTLIIVVMIAVFISDLKLFFG